MLLLLSTGTDRPNRLEDAKDKLYHQRWGRYCAYDANNFMHQQFLARTLVNKNFYKGDQWLFDEDLEVFFKDESGQSRNRLKMRHNIIRPMVMQFRGNAIRMNIEFGANSVSSRAINRRESKLNEMRYYTYMANAVPVLGDKLRDKLPIGKDEAETEAIFENLWVDDYVETIKDLLAYVSNLNKFSNKQDRVAEELAFSGLAVFEAYEQNGHQKFDLLRSEDYFFDRSCKEYDHSDAEYWGRQYYMNATDIYEQYELLSKDEKAAIEKYSKSYQKNRATETQMLFGGKIPTLKTFWKDTEMYEYGYVMDEFGYPYLTRINFTEEGDKEPKYTTKDLIEVDSVRSEKVLGGKKSRKLAVDIIRFCHFIPSEVISSVYGGGQSAIGDIVLEYGVMPYQETDNLDISACKSPFKVYCWAYVNGEVLSPIDDAIDPQRFLNRLLSVAENQINNSGGSGIIYDKSLIDNELGEAGMIKNINQSKPVPMNLRGRGVQNAVGSYDNTLNKGTMQMFEIMENVKNQLKDVTGLNEALQGEGMGADQLVGVTQLMIQRGSLMQEPFYNAITAIYEQMYQSIATVGKRIYADNDRELAIAVGDGGAKILKISKDMNMEDFRVFIKRENNREALVQAANSMLMTLMELGFVDKESFANMYNRSTPDEIAKGLRTSVKTDVEKERIQQKAMAKQQENMAQQEQGQQAAALTAQAHDEDRQDKLTSMTQDHDIDKVFAKGLVDHINSSVNPTPVK